LQFGHLINEGDEVVVIVIEKRCTWSFLFL
jgi:hypothetical protein